MLVWIVLCAIWLIFGWLLWKFCRKKCTLWWFWDKLVITTKWKHEKFQRAKRWQTRDKRRITAWRELWYELKASSVLMYDQTHWMLWRTKPNIWCFRCVVPLSFFVFCRAFSISSAQQLCYTFVSIVVQMGEKVTLQKWLWKFVDCIWLMLNSIANRKSCAHFVRNHEIFAHSFSFHSIVSRNISSIPSALCFRRRKFPANGTILCTRHIFNIRSIFILFYIRSHANWRHLPFYLTLTISRKVTILNTYTR